MLFLLGHKDEDEINDSGPRAGVNLNQLVARFLLML